MAYKAIALDLDGTLTNSDKKITDTNKKAIWRAIEAGVKVILASGRPPLGIRPVADELKLKEYGGYILAYNGARIIDCTNGDIILDKTLPKECIEGICTISKQCGVCACTYNDTSIVAENDDDEYMIKEAKCNSASILKVDSICTYVDYPVNKFLLVGPHEKLLKAQKALLDRYAAVIDAFFSEDYFLEVVGKNIAKSSSLELLLNRLSIKREELIACGDGMNDIPMLQYAGLGVAMANAYPKVKESADVTTISNDEDGVAAVIEQYIVGQGGIL